MHTNAFKPAKQCPQAAKSKSTVVHALPKDVFASLGKASVAAAAVAALTFASPAQANLNKFEESTRGEFGMGTAQQYGEADLVGRDFEGLDLRRSNFTSADFRKANFKNAKLNGTYLMKSIGYKSDFTNADVSDALWDRSVLNDAILRNAILQRTVFTMSDLGGADIYGADFTNALIDRAQQVKLCRYADGTNSVTGVDTRRSLGCGSRRAFKAQSPSSPDGPAVSDEEKAAFVKSLALYRDGSE